MHKDEYLEICGSIIQSVISLESLKLQAYNLPQIHSYSRSINLPTAQVAKFPTILDSFLSTSQALVQG